MLSPFSSIIILDIFKFNIPRNIVILGTKIYVEVTENKNVPRVKIIQIKLYKKNYKIW